jgi:hypothetical protein
LRNKLRVCWKGGLSGVVSLLDMMEIYAYFFIEATNQLTAWEKTLGEDDRKTLMKPEYAAQLFAKVGTFGALCAAHGFRSSVQQCVRIHEDMQSKKMLVKCGDIRIDLRELRRRFEDELKALPFFQLSMEELGLYKSPKQKWEKVIKRFPKTQIDIEESARCYAFGRYAASLFHALLVAEYGVIVLAKLLQVAGDKPGWAALERLERISDKPYKDRSPLEQKYSSVLDGMMPFAHSIKNEWRHKINHMENRLVWLDTDFSPQMAGDIINAVRGFMHKLATELPAS